MVTFKVWGPRVEVGGGVSWVALSVKKGKSLNSVMIMKEFF